MNLLSSHLGKHAVRRDTKAAAALGLTVIEGTGVTCTLYPRTQSPVGRYGELRPVLVRGDVVYMTEPEAPTVSSAHARAYASDYARQAWQPGMFEWAGHRPATRRDYADYLTKVHPRVAAAIEQAARTVS